MFLALGLHVADGYFIFSLFVFVLMEGFLETVFSRPGCESLFMFLLFGALAAARGSESRAIRGRATSMEVLGWRCA